MFHFLIFNNWFDKNMYCYHKDNDNISIFVLKYLLNKINYMVIILISLFSYFLLIFNIFVWLYLHEVIN